MTSTAKTAILLLSGASLLGPGNCLPNDFWIDAWGEALATTAATIYEVTVLNPVVEALDGE